MDESVRILWVDAFQQELECVSRRRSEAGEGPVNEDLVGLAFSGGGIRSATFGLGVLEGLKHHGLLNRIDYLSTVSGGGYIGAWLSANCQQAFKAKEPSWLRSDAEWKPSVDHLRRYSNYLSPILGFFSADTWSMATIWLRNSFLVQLTVVLAIAVLLLLPRPVFAAFEYWPHAGEWRWATIFLFILGAVGIAGNQLRLSRNGNVPLLQGKSWPYGLAGALTCLAAAGILGIVRNFQPFSDGPIDYWAAAPIAGLLILAGFWLQPAGVQFLNKLWPGKRPPKQINYSQPWVETLVVIPMMLTGFLVAAVLWGQSNAGDLAQIQTFGGFFGAAWRQWPFPLSVVFLSLWLFSLCSIRDWRDWKCLLAGLLAPLPAMLLLHLLLSAIMLLLHAWASIGLQGEWLAYIFAPAMVLFAFSLTIVILIGMLGRQSPEGEREWWSRFGAWLAIYGFAWLFVNVVAVFGPLFSAYLLDQPWKGTAIGGGWVGTTLAGLFAGKSGSTNGIHEKTTTAKALEVVAVVAPFVFIAGLLVAVATVLHLAIAHNSGLIWQNVGELSGKHWYMLSFADPWVTAAVFAVCLVCVLVLAARVDINEFSLNAFYRSRLVRCYLGAARFRKDERNPQKFTGFDDADDLKLASLADPRQPLVGPMQIVNCALNLGGSSDLALHTRHSAVFTLTPLHCGSRYMSHDLDSAPEELGYFPTHRYGGGDGQPTLGQAISVSGAAASPNMGYHTSPVVAFLMTLFNARLGWWFPNPRLSRATSPSPLFSLRYLVKELFGGADDKTKFLAISDGGHFENLAAYELIRRQCRVIIVSDAECDPKLQFEGLATFIRMCEVDFGAKIHIDAGSIRPHGESTWSTSRCAVGTIEYPGGAPGGTLIYLKASMTGHDDTAVLQYKATHPTFPHESTGNQFYGEGQFESYRTLGRDIAWKTFGLVSDVQDLVTKAAKLETTCSPSLHNAAQFTKHTTRLMEIWSELGGNPDFHMLDKEFAGSWPEHPSSSFRSAFYLCSEMIQLMENVYLDLGLEDTWLHPDNQGWRTLFDTWSKSPAIQKTWEFTAGTYGLRFQHFCHRQLKLPAPG